MYHLQARSLVLLVFVSVMVSCAASQPAPKTTPSEAAVAGEAAVKAADSHDESAAEQPTEDEPNPEGPIDLEVGDDDGEGDIVINRPEGSDTEEGLDDEDALDDGEQLDNEDELEDGEQLDDEDELEDGEQLDDEDELEDGDQLDDDEL